MSSVSQTQPDILVMEPFYCGSHKQLVDCLMKDAVIGPRSHLITMSGKKWHWRARVAALHLSTAIPANHKFRVLFSSSVLNLAELVALRPDLAGLHKVLYFHENQLQYPVRKQKDRDFQYGYNQILSCLVADCVLFNSSFNMESFLSSINSFLKLMPDYRPKGLADRLRPKCSVVYFPLVYQEISQCQKDDIPCLPGNSSIIQTVSSDKGQNPVQKAGLTSDPALRVHCTVNDDVSECQKDQESSDHGVQKLSCVECSHQDSGPHSDCATHVHYPEVHSQEEGGCPEQSQQSNQDDTDCDGMKQHKRQKVDYILKIQSHLTKTSTSADVTPSQINDCTSKLQTHQAKSGCDVKQHDHHQEQDKKVSVPPGESVSLNSGKTQDSIHIVWPHRWEHDKDPDTFFQVLFRLQDEGVPFMVSVLGETFTDVPDIFAEAEKKMKDHIYAWGYQTEKSAYLQILQAADVVVSTSKHEFFGVAMLEAVHHGCYPLCPKALVYPEIYPEECLYSTPAQLFKRLRSFCRHPHLVRDRHVQVDVHKFSWDILRYQYLEKLQIKS